MTADPRHLDLPVSDFLARVAAPTPAPAAGAVSATVVALAAGLAAMSAGLSSRQLAEADDLAARAAQLQRRAMPLGQRDGDAYAAVLAARARPADDPERSSAVRTALSEASDVPLEIAEVGVAVIDIAADVVRRGNPNLRGDAHTACLMAQAAVRAAVVLVELNLAGQAEDPRMTRAHEIERAARDLVERLAVG